MRIKYIASIFLSTLAFANSSFANNWIPISANCSGACTYIDKTRIKKDRGIVQVVALTDYASISSAQMFGLSEINELSINCIKKEFQNTQIIWYERNMGMGKVTKKEMVTNKKWFELQRFSSEEKLANFVCN
jgi:hypothetical protein